MVNLMSQEYDALKVLSTIPEHTELYKYKFEQYKKLSEVRAKCEVFLQEQRLQRLSKNFELQTKDVERNQRHEAWLDDEKRKLYQHKVVDLGEGDLLNQPSMFAQEQPKSRKLLDTVSFTKNETEQEELDDSNLMIYFDAVLKCTRDIKDAELCYCI